MRLVSFVATASIALCACALDPADDASLSTRPHAQPQLEESLNKDPAAEGFRTQFESIRGASFHGRPGSLCHTLRRGSAGAGLYEVISIESVIEEDKELQEFHPRTYVKLQRLEAWTADAPEQAVLRLQGGGYPNGVSGGWLVSFAVGETYGVALAPPTESNLNFYSVSRTGVFAQRSDGRYSNGMIFSKAGASAEELARAIRKRAGLTLAECKKDDIRSDWDTVPQGLLVGEKKTADAAEPKMTDVVLENALEQ
jgi:hypothetical protein